MNCSRDVKLSADGAEYYFRFLEWDTDFFGINSYILDIDRSKLLPSQKIKELAAEKLKDSFVTAKVGSNISGSLLAFLQELGFGYIDTEITLKHDKQTAGRAGKAQGTGVRVFEMENNSGLSYKELGSVFEHTRFHTDTHIPKDRADGVWINYIKTYKPSKTRRMFIAECDGKTAGSILVNQSDDSKSANLFFVGVVKEFQGRKVGSSLMRHVLDEFKDTELTVGTQGKNLSALNFYIKNGFSNVHVTKLVFHRWA